MSSPTVLFDLGNVLVKLNFERGLSRFRQLAARQASQRSIDRDLLFFSEPSLACNRGEINANQFLAAVQQMLGEPAISTALIADAWCDIFDRWPLMEELAEQVIDAGHDCYLLSNTDPLHFAYLYQRIPVLHRFSGMHLSYEVKSLKPDPVYFHKALERFQLAAKDCVFIDDRADHVLSAQSVGITSLVHDGQVFKVRGFLRAHGVKNV